MIFLTVSIINVLFAKRELTWRSYILAKNLSITKWMQLIGRKKFAIPTLDLKKEAFVVHMSFSKAMIFIYPACET